MHLVGSVEAFDSTADQAGASWFARECCVDQASTVMMGFILPVQDSGKANPASRGTPRFSIVDITEPRRDKRQGGSKIETIVEEELLDGDEENAVEEQLDVSWQPVE